MGLAFSSTARTRHLQKYRTHAQFALADGIQCARFRKNRPSVAYLGWTGRGNVGDNAIFYAHRRGLLGHMEAFPPDRFEKLLGNAESVRGILLGGGTVVGRGDWLPRISRVEESFPGRLKFAIGVGVEDPAFLGERSQTNDDQMSHWVAKLASFDSVTVRGPRSAAILGRLGLTATVVGDPALLIGTPTSGMTIPDRPIVGVNVPLLEDSWGGSMDAFQRELPKLVFGLVKAGAIVRLLSMTKEDELAARKIASLNPNVEVVAFSSDVDWFMAQLSRCNLVVGPRLHLSILAASIGLPFLSIAYKPKGLDFAESVGMSEFVIRSDEFEARTALGLIEHIIENYSEFQRHICDRVSVLQKSLRTQTIECRNMLMNATRN